MELQRELVKIIFETDSSGLSGGSPERLWGRRLSDKTNFFEIVNSPFYAKGISYLDIVEAVEDIETGAFNYLRTQCQSGHSTYRILIDKDSKYFLNRWQELENMGCTYEYSDEGTKLLYAVDVPNDSNIFDVYAILEKGEQDGVWLFDEGHCGHPISK